MQTEKQHKGDLGEIKTKAKLTEQGVICSTPESRVAYDLIADDGKSLHRIQVKTVNKKERNGRDTYEVNFRKTGRYYEGDLKSKEYTKNEIDAFAVYNEYEDEVYLLWIEEAPSWGTDKKLESWRKDMLSDKI